MPDYKEIQDKWQKAWEEKGIFRVKEDPKKRKFYCLEMFPYPSAAFLHMGHVRNYSIGDTIARYKRLKGFNVLYPIGYDSFGLPAENAAKKQKIHPRKYTEDAIKNIMKYQRELGFSYDFSRLIATHRPEYYKWNQYFFIKFFEKGLAYRKKAAVNYCLQCNTVLANEEVDNNKCWRCDNEVVQKELDQWFLKTTAYTEELLNDIKNLGWSDKIKAIQENWIGKSHGLMINFKLDDGSDFPIYTTRPDTIYGVTFMVIALNHHKLFEMIHEPYKSNVLKFIKEVKDAEAKEDTEFLEKNGVFTGRYVINPLNNEKVPLYAGNFVVADYATGCIMAVPAHDQRDYEFAKKYDIPIKQVIAPNFVLSGKNAPKEDVETLYRDCIDVIIEHPVENKFLLLEEKDNNIFVGGGIEKDESAKDALRREIIEETGFVNFEIKKIILHPIFAHGFRINKNKNQKTKNILFHVKLKDEERVKSEIEKNKHRFIWMSPEKIKDTITWENHRFYWDYFYKGGYALTDPGILVNSGSFNGLTDKEAIERISDHVEKSGIGKRAVQYKLKDWLISRQRYWGTPIPIVYCAKCGTVPLPVGELPLLLPDDIEFNDKGNPLLTSKTFIEAKCPICNHDAKRETDTMGGFMDSSWYFLRYCSPHTTDIPFDKDAVKYWMPVDQYVGGIEHAVGHLIYSRFFTKALRDMKMIDVDEPFNALFNQGIVYKDGHKMSKSFGNIVTQDEIAAKYGIDTARLFMLFVASPDKDMEWNDKGVDGMFKFINRIYRLYEEFPGRNSFSNSKDRNLVSKKNMIVRELTAAIDEFKLNNAVIHLMDLVNYVFDVIDDVSNAVLRECLADLAVLLNPFAPHLSEECWHMLSNDGFSSAASWPVWREELIDARIHHLEQVFDNIRRDIVSVLGLAKIDRPSSITLIIPDKWKYELFSLVKEKMLTVRNPSEIIKHVMNSDLKRHGQDIMRIVPKLAEKIPEIVNDQDSEYRFFNDNSKALSEEFRCTINIILAEDSREQKARQAMPGKPAIIVK